MSKRAENFPLWENSVDASIQELITNFTKDMQPKYDNDLFGTLEFYHASPGSVVARFFVQDFMCNMAGNLHGAVCQWVQDDLTTLALLSLDEKRRIGATVHLSMDYYVLAPRGSRVYAEAKVDKTGSSMGFAIIRIFTDDGKLMARGAHTKYLAAKEGGYGSVQKKANL